MEPRPTLTHPEIWLPAAIAVLVTQVVAIRNGWSGITDLHRYIRACPRLRWVFRAGRLINSAHFYKIGPRRLDPYSALSNVLVAHGRETAQQTRRDLERARSA